MIERSVVNLKADSLDRSNLNKTKNKQKKPDTEDSFQKRLEKEDKNFEAKQENSNEKLEKIQKEESEEGVKEKIPKNQEDKKKKEENVVEIVSFLNIKDLPKESKKTGLSEKNLEEIKVKGNTEKIVNIKNTEVNQEELKIKVNTEEASKLGKEEILLENGEEIKGNENLNLKDLKGLKESEKDEKKEVKLEDIKASKEAPEKKKVQTFKGESSQDNEFKEELNKKLETLKENINSIDDKKEEKEATFTENLKNSIDQAKESFNKEKIMTEAVGKGTEKTVFGKENIIEQLAKNITTGKTDEGNFLKIQLKPDILGEMTVKLSEGKEGMIATISAEKEVVKNLLRNSGEQITTMLSEKNIKVSSVVIETNQSEKQDFNLFSDTSQEDFSGEENRQENFSNSRFSNYGQKLQTSSSHKNTDEIYSGNGINFYI